MNCLSRRHAPGAAPVATIEWCDVVSGWRPVCDECRAIIEANYARAFSENDDPIVKRGISMMLRFRPLPVPDRG